MCLCKTSVTRHTIVAIAIHFRNLSNPVSSTALRRAYNLIFNTLIIFPETKSKVLNTLEPLNFSRSVFSGYFLNAKGVFNFQMCLRKHFAIENIGCLKR
jgi:hypothetical protein